MLSLLAIFVFLSAIIVVAGCFLTRFADGIAEATGLGRTLAGLVLLAAATSLPELAVDISAVLIPNPSMAVGALVGSSIFNLLILGVLDFCHRRNERIFSPASAHHALSAIVTMTLTGIVVVFVVLKQFPLQWMGVGLGSALIALFYLASLRLIYLDQRAQQTGEIEELISEVAVHVSLPKAIGGYVLCTTVIFIAANYLAPTADQLATVTGLGGTFVGSTFVALTTSLPEVVTTAAAVRMGAFDLAVGNVLGSNAFNMAILFPVDLVYRQGSLLADADLSNAVTAGAVIVLTGLTTISMLYRPSKRYWLIEPDAALVIVLGIASFVALYFLGQMP